MKLDISAVRWAIGSLDRHGDTDLFPRPIELTVMSSDLDKSAAQIAGIDISNHQPSAPRRFIVPKDDLSYRAATQLDPLDSAIFLSIIYQFGAGIENRRRPIAEASVFSYRFAPTPDGDLYGASDAWSSFWGACLVQSAGAGAILAVDIADYYNQIYHHVIENQLIESGFPNAATKWTLRMLEKVSAKVSRGIPVGPHAAHMLAEASLIPIDNSLAARGVRFCRFVDDIVVFVKDQNAARTALFQLAETLDKQQRLQLQKSKTKIFEPAEFQNHVRSMLEDRPINDLESLLLGIIKKYSRGDPYRIVYLNDISADDLAAFSQEAIEKILEEYLNAEPPDYVRLRWFLRRLSQVGHPAAISYCIRNMGRMAPATSEICRYLISVGDRGAQLDWTRIGGDLLSLLQDKVIQSAEYFQLSILSLFGRNTQLNHLAALLDAYKSASPFARRKIIITAAAAHCGDWLRELKEEFTSMDPWTRRAFLCAARELPAEERKFFLKFDAAKSPLETLICDWAKQ